MQNNQTKKTKNQERLKRRHGLVLGTQTQEMTRMVLRLKIQSYQDIWIIIHKDHMLDIF
jgi:hypothetical protein